MTRVSELMIFSRETSADRVETEVSWGPGRGLEAWSGRELVRSNRIRACCALPVKPAGNPRTWVNHRSPVYVSWESLLKR